MGVTKKAGTFETLSTNIDKLTEKKQTTISRYLRDKILYWKFLKNGMIIVCW